MDFYKNFETGFGKVSKMALTRSKRKKEIHYFGASFVSRDEGVPKMSEIIKYE